MVAPAPGQGDVTDLLERCSWVASEGFEQLKVVQFLFFFNLIYFGPAQIYNDGNNACASNSWIFLCPDLGDAVQMHSFSVLSWYVWRPVITRTGQNHRIMEYPDLEGIC